MNNIGRNIKIIVDVYQKRLATGLETLSPGFGDCIDRRSRASQEYETNITIVELIKGHG